MALIIAFFLVVGQALAADFLVKTFVNSNMEPTAMDPLLNVEVHCFETRMVGGARTPFYVRGTYGNYGYFEGSVSNKGSATVSFYETTVVGKNLVPSTGAGVLQYSSDMLTVTSGFYWGSGSSANSAAHSGSWGITGPCTASTCPSTLDANKVATANQFCFWDADGSLGYTSYENVNPPNGMVFSTPGTVNSANIFLQNGIGSSYTTGSTMGAYNYIYPPAACAALNLDCADPLEKGTYGTTALSSPVSNSFILNAVWLAKSGPMAHESGSALYAFVNSAGGVPSVWGFFCNSRVKSGGAVLYNCGPDNMTGHGAYSRPSTVANVAQHYHMGNTSALDYLVEVVDLVL